MFLMLYIGVRPGYKIGSVPLGVIERLFHFSRALVHKIYMVHKFGKHKRRGSRENCLPDATEYLIWTSEGGHAHGYIVSR